MHPGWWEQPDRNGKTEGLGRCPMALSEPEIQDAGQVLQKSFVIKYLFTIRHLGSVSSTVLRWALCAWRTSPAKLPRHSSCAAMSGRPRSPAILLSMHGEEQSEKGAEGGG